MLPFAALHESAIDPKILRSVDATDLVGEITGKYRPFDQGRLGGLKALARPEVFQIYSLTNFKAVQDGKHGSHIRKFSAINLADNITTEKKRLHANLYWQGSAL